MNRHLLSLAALHAAAPGAIDVVFGPDGDFEGAPRWKGPYSYLDPMDELYRFMWCENHTAMTVRPAFGQRCFLDLRIPSVAARLAGLCARAGHPDLGFQDNEVIAQARYGGPSWNEAWAVRLAALTLALAPRIAALRSTT